MTNPLFAEEYSKTMVDRLTNLEIGKDPILEDEKMAQFVQKKKIEWKESDRKARKLQKQGMIGQIIEIKEHSKGQALLIQNILFLGPGFVSMPGPDLRLFLTEAIDPRDLDFPDASSIDLGIVESPIGAQRYKVPMTENYERLRTAVLFDVSLGRLYGFAQLSN